MTTRVRVEQDACGRVRVDLRTGELAPRLLDREPGVVRVALVATVALLLADDDVVIEVEVGPGVQLEIVETAGTVAYDMRGRAASWRVEAVVHDDATLVWAGLPFVVSAGACVTRRTSLSLADNAGAVLRETLVLGRTGEEGGDLLTCTDVHRPDGRPVLREDLDLTRATRQRAATLGGARCLDQLTVLGARAELDGPGVLQLAAPGTVVRTLTQEAHESALTALSSYFQMEIARRSEPETAAKQPLPRILPIGCIARGNDAVRARATGH